MEGSFEAPAVKKLKTGEGSGVVVHVVGGEAAGRGGGSSAVASDGGSGTRGAISSGGAGGSQGGGSDAAVGEAEGLDLDVHFVKNEVSFPFFSLSVLRLFIGLGQIYLQNRIVVLVLSLDTDLGHARSVFLGRFYLFGVFDIDISF